MASIEANGLLTLKDSAGNLYLVYPITKLENIEDLEEATETVAGLMPAASVVKLKGIEEGANKYSHPTSAGHKHIPSGGASNNILRWSANGTAVWGAEKDTTYSVATSTANGLLSADDKKKLDSGYMVKVDDGGAYIEI